MREFISFARAKETEPKKNRPEVSAFGCSVRFSLNRARRTRYAQTGAALIRPSLPVLDDPKGVDDSKSKSDSEHPLILTFVLTYSIPFRLAEKCRMSWGFGGRLFERSEFAPRQLNRASQGTQKGFLLGKHAGGLSFGTFSLAIKEKILAHEGRNTRFNSK